jgi:2-amino-4-hydroxy-6-hydroxymethyldihydropteridine diphosphokinase
MTRVYIAIGSNLEDPIRQAKNAIKALQALPKTNWVCASSLYASKPMGPSEQPDYINAVVAIDTDLSPLDLLEKTQQIELQHGRVRKEVRWGPRTLDLDILLYGDLELKTDKLTLPHHGINVREFVLYPLAEIAADLTFPDGTTLSYWLSRVEKNGLTPVLSPIA